MHEYTECYLYWSMMTDECDEYVKKIWTRHLEQEIAHLHNAARLLEKYEGKHWSEVIPDGAMPDPLLFGEASDANKAYIRKLLAHTVENTAYGDGWSDLSEVPSSSEFFKYNAKVNGRGQPQDNRQIHHGGGRGLSFPGARASRA